MVLDVAEVEEGVVGSSNRYVVCGQVSIVEDSCSLVLFVSMLLSICLCHSSSWRLCTCLWTAEGFSTWCGNCGDENVSDGAGLNEKMFDENSPWLVNGRVW